MANQLIKRRGTLEESTERCWSDLPPELLSLILSRLFLKDKGRFKSVCKSWSLINPIIPSCLDSPHLDTPCLMTSQSSTSCWKLFHSLYNEFYDLDFPELMGAEIHFSKHGWLLMSRLECPLFFFNPFTKEKVELPRNPCPFLSVCFTSPPTSSDCFIFGFLEPSTISQTMFGLIKFGDRKWKVGHLDNGTHNFRTSNCPPLYYNGVYYCFDSRTRSIRKFDPTKEDEHRWTYFGKCREPIEDEEEEEEENEDEEQEDNGDEDGNDKDVQKTYVVGVGGEIWGVFVTNNLGRVSVEKLDLSEMRWKKLESLGDKCLYLSNSGSFAETCLASDLANKIYFNYFYGKNGVVYCLSSGMYHSIAGDFTSKRVAGNNGSNEVCGPGLAQMEQGTWIKPSMG